MQTNFTLAQLADPDTARSERILRKSRNLCLYPNVYLMDQFSSQIRMYRPISVDKTEVTIYCIAPKGESDAARAHRIRQYEDFFNASGMATPDDLEEFRSCQIGYGAGNDCRQPPDEIGKRHGVRERFTRRNRSGKNRNIVLLIPGARYFHNPLRGFFKERHPVPMCR